MSLRIVVVLVVLTGVTGSSNVTIRPEADSADMSTHLNSVPETATEIHIFEQVRKELALAPNHFAGFHLLGGCIPQEKHGLTK